MNKSDLVLRLAEKLDQVPQKDLNDCINEILDYMTVSLANGERIEIRGFGSFSLHYRPPRKAHNPKTGERLLTDAKHQPHFKPGKEMRERINESVGKYPLIQDEDEESSLG